MNAEEYERLLTQLDARIAEFETHVDPSVRDRALELLRHVDAIHREGLLRLVELLGARDPRWFDEAVRDPVLRLFLALYELELAPAERTDAAFVPLQDLRQSAALARMRARKEP